jgi:hypothetical protein
VDALTIEQEITIAATALYEASVRSKDFQLYLSEDDFARILAEFGRSVPRLVCPVFTVNVAPERTARSFISDKEHWTYLRPLVLRSIDCAPLHSDG